MHRSQQQEKRPPVGAEPLFLEVQIHQSQMAGWSYTWDRDRGQIRLLGRQAGCADLPADLAFLHLGQQAEIPVYVFASPGIAVGALVKVRILGAFCSAEARTGDSGACPLAGWTLFAAPEVVGLLPSDERHTPLLAGREATLHRYLLSRAEAVSGNLVRCSVTEVAQRLRKARVWSRHVQRQQAYTQRQISRSGEERAVAWRAIEGITSEQRAQVARVRSIDQLVPLLQAEQLIHVVPQRFQRALEHLLLPDERLLAFIERPRLNHRTGWLNMRHYHANAGLFLVTDRQALFLRDVFSPGTSLFPEGYIARSIPLERLVDCVLIPAGIAPATPGRSLREGSLPLS